MMAIVQRWRGWIERVGATTFDAVLETEIGENHGTLRARIYRHAVPTAQHHLLHAGAYLTWRIDDAPPTSTIVLDDRVWPTVDPRRVAAEAARLKALLCRELPATSGAAPAGDARAVHPVPPAPDR